MSEFRISSTGIRFLSSTTLIETAKRLEKELAGWWWSVSQKKQLVTISFGPGQNCPNLIDVEFLKTSVGDKGFVNRLCFDSSSQEKDFLYWLDSVIRIVNPYREVLQEDHPEISQNKIESIYRYQTEDQLIDLKDVYDIFLNGFPLIENQGHLINELYLGSCDFSVDCSIRGCRNNNSSFDISIDLTDKEKSIADSLAHSVVEVKNDILTHRKNQ